MEDSDYYHKIINDLERELQKRAKVAKVIVVELAQNGPWERMAEVLRVEQTPDGLEIWVR